MHERMFGKPVAVELVDSVLRGAPRCRFRITLA
jgi:predicted hydrocarbon binding protein